MRSQGSPVATTEDGSLRKDSEMRVRYKHAKAVSLGLVLSGAVTATAFAEGTRSSQRRAASEAFTMCREQATEGDATPCWRVWLRKFRAVGSESELAYAEEHGAPPPEPAPSAVPSDDTPPAESSPPPRRKRGHGGDSERAPAAEEGEAGEEAQAGSGAAGSANSLALGSVLDFCALKPRVDATRFVKQRVIVFAVAGADALTDNDAVKSVEGPQLVREVFSARFPLDRFHNVVASFDGKPEWAVASSVSLDDLAAVLAPQGDEQLSDDEKREREFVRYSAACADYLVFPTIESHEASWSEQEVQTKNGGKKKVRVLTVKLTGAVGIFKRDGSTFNLVQTIRESVPGGLDFATDAVAGSIPDVNVDLHAAGMNLVAGTAKSVLHLPPYISAIPNAACVLTGAARDGVAGLAKCAKQGAGSATLAASTLDERASDVCKEATDEKTPKQRQQVAMVTCEVRSRAAQLARSLQKAARNVEGWKLFAPLQRGIEGDPEADALSLGREEGVKIGYGFWALSPTREELAYFKVTDLGPGGEVGIGRPSTLNLRSGEAPEGSRLEEYPQMGISIMPYGGGGMLMTSGQSRVSASNGTSVYDLPKTVWGGGGNVSYDLSPHLGLVETYLRIGAGYFVGNGPSTKAAVIPIDVIVEKGFYLGSRVTWYFAAGSGTTMVKVEVAPTAAGSAGQKLSASVYGAVGRTGLDIMLSPDVNLRLDAFGRMNFGAAKYEDENGNPAVNGWETRKDKYGMVGGTGALAWTF